MKLASAVLVGLLSGFMVYTFLWLLFLGPSTQNASPYLWFILAWAISSYAVYFGTESVLAVWARGALLGAGEWLAAGLAGVFIHTKIWVDTSPGMTSGAERTGTELDPVVSMVGVVGSFSLAIFCLLIWFVVNKTKPEFQERLSP